MFDVVVSPEGLILFDIDGTLLSAGGAPRRAFRRALLEYFDTEGGAATDRFAGKTDPQILYDLMLAEGFGADHIDERVADFFTFYLGELERELEVETRHRLHPGVDELVPALADDPRIVLGLVTGNVEAGARLKLRHFRLWDHFAVGAFGSDDRVRDRLPPIAVERAEARTGRRFSPAQVVIVGDTPADIGCARAVGAVAVAVATGVHSRAELATYAPDHLLDTLEEWPSVLAALDLAGPPSGARLSPSP